MVLGAEEDADSGDSLKTGREASRLAGWSTSTLAHQHTSLGAERDSYSIETIISIYMIEKQ